jgi:hypothetical protein
METQLPIDPVRAPTFPTELCPIPDRPPKEREIRGKGREAMAVARSLGDFDYQSSPAWKGVTERFGEHIRIAHLRSLACVFHALFPEHIPSLSRTDIRRFSLLIKWFDTHWVFLSQILPYVWFEDEASRKILLV